MKNHFPKILLLISTTLFLLFCFAFVFVYKKINNNHEEIKQNTINLQTENSRRDNIASLNQYLQKISPDTTSLESHFIKSSDIVPFLNMIEKLALKGGVSAEINSVNAKIDNTELLVDLKATGRFETIYKFLTLLENSPYEIEFMSMDMHKINLSAMSDNSTKDSRWEAIFKIKLLSLIP